MTYKYSTAQMGAHYKPTSANVHILINQQQLMILRLVRWHTICCLPITDKINCQKKNK